jgi:hypothetical protein
MKREEVSADVYRRMLKSGPNMTDIRRYFSLIEKELMLRGMECRPEDLGRYQGQFRIVKDINVVLNRKGGGQ